MKLLVTGAAGFIGSSFLRQNTSQGNRFVVLDKLTYAGNLKNITDLIENATVEFIHGDICDFEMVDSLFKKHQFDGVVHFAAETHVDNSISGPSIFLRTNVEGTFTLLEVMRKNIEKLRPSFKFVHVSTDEVFGELGSNGYFSEQSPYRPNSPYSATKASSDHLVRAWHHTYGLPTLITNCSNNYGPRQFQEKLIPRMISNALADKKLPIYGNGENIRDWIHVDDHTRGIWLAFELGTPGETYCFGGKAEVKNVDVVNSICLLLDEMAPRLDGKSYQKQIAFVEDRLGHDFRYAIDNSYVEEKLNFQLKYQNFQEGLRQTVQWYLQNKEWANSSLIKDRRFSL